jgi:IS30 family transposase
MTLKEFINLAIQDKTNKKITFSLGKLLEAENILNNRPRKRYGFKTPNEVLSLTLLNNGIVALIT